MLSHQLLPDNSHSVALTERSPLLPHARGKQRAASLHGVLLQNAARLQGQVKIKE